MAAKLVMGPITTGYQADGHTVEIAQSGDRKTLKHVSDGSEVIEGVAVPTWIEYTTTGGADPDMRMRVELRDGSPEIVELAWTSKPQQSVIRQKHLRRVDLADLINNLVVSTIRNPLFPRDAENRPDPFDFGTDGENFEESKRMAQKFVERQRLPRERRVMTPEFLRSVAEVYRMNIDGAPTKAVAKVFNVKDRMASTYVDRARQAGFLPPTKQGQKKA
ncbi:hypothetical protein OG921_12730 [Aldersonia sp. NBC_00410]|uniref:hypothetical protein n=1 Tax=Aldersonia sp. NBC_00410 TaxID=2975954 RepID=UPI00225713BA|nr:hypothetical protein [Aldersonia sp. NBC_00410]MCX5044034.1 hypothetical protein [Aldersonia sp. NBC_00410]